MKLTIKNSLISCILNLDVECFIVGCWHIGCAFYTIYTIHTFCIFYNNAQIINDYENAMLLRLFLFLGQVYRSVN